LIKVRSRGSFNNVTKFLERMKRREELTQLEKFGPIGVAALQAATPVETGATAHSWTYEIINRPGYYSIQWINVNTEEPGHIPIAVLIQYGHATRTGGYVQGRDFINPALRPIFDQIAADMWKEVTR
jgi:hypothetical protein